jgi:hypothetical protein
VTLSAILLVFAVEHKDTKKIVTIRSLDSASEGEGGPQEGALLPACYDNSTTVRAREALALVFVDEDLAPQTIPERIFARKPYTSTCECPSICYLASDRVFRPAGTASKSCRPKSCGRPPRNQGKRTFGEPSRPELVVARGQGRGPQRGRVPREHSNRRLRPQGQEDRGRACPASRCARSSLVLHFLCIRLYATRENEEGSCFLEKPPKQENTKSSPSLSMELKFELDTQLTISCVVPVASAYGLVTVSIAHDSILLAFGNAIILSLILFVLFGWRELSGELNKKRSTAN